MADSTCSVRVRGASRARALTSSPRTRVRGGWALVLASSLVSPLSAVLLSWAHVSPAILCSMSRLTALSQTRWVTRSRGSSTSKPPLNGIAGRQLALYKEKALARMRMFGYWESGAYVHTYPMLRSLPDKKRTACRYRSAAAVFAAARLPVPARVCCMASACYTSCIFSLLGCCRALQHAPAFDFRSHAHIL